MSTMEKRLNYLIVALGATLFCTILYVEYAYKPGTFHRKVAKQRIFIAKFKNRQFNYSIEEQKPGLCDGIDILILILSAPNKFDQRNAIRDTWLYEHDTPSSFLVRFLIGQPDNRSVELRIQKEQRQHKDIVRYNFTETYDLLPVKVHAAFSFFKTYCPQAKYLLKTDDDTVVDLDRLFHHSKSMYDKYYGLNKERFFCNVHYKKRPFRNKGSRYYVSKEVYPEPIYPDFCQGCSYMVTREAVGPVLSAVSSVNYIKLEDVLYSGIVRSKKNVSLVHSRTFGYSSIKATNKLQCGMNGVPLPTGLFGIPAKSMQSVYKELKNISCRADGGTTKKG
ncbi:unnamed protein product [Bursaphelenchus xylophilus]|uniref:Hexosyltransferase n=1 Tax=Bursaphelenchus xylophilus TaxID=6326 RepID=A0A1I7SUR0_BURXY|nr:unnamed protein product [Bursaphelenchus xylophilus]CAG9125937.1 unnamed protein product [Bursaphelenchus xylophilus]